MKQAVLSQWDLPYLPITALLIFLLCFGAYVYWTFKKCNKRIYQEASEIPLNDPIKVSLKNERNKS